MARLLFLREQTSTDHFAMSRKGQELTYAPQQTPPLFDHLVGARGEPGRRVKPERLGGLKVDHELELGGLIDRQVSGLLALEDPSDVETGPAVRVWRVVALAHQPALFDKFTVGVHVRDGVTRRQRDNLLATAGKEGARHRQVARRRAVVGRWRRRY
jgi:hypothetical protein